MRTSLFDCPSYDSRCGMNLRSEYENQYPHSSMKQLVKWQFNLILELHQN